MDKEFVIDTLAGKLTTFDAVVGYISQLEMKLQSESTAMHLYVVVMRRGERRAVYGVHTSSEELAAELAISKNNGWKVERIVQEDGDKAMLLHRDYFEPPGPKESLPICRWKDSQASAQLRRQGGAHARRYAYR